MSNRFAFAAIAASFALTACGSTGAGETSAQAPVQSTVRPSQFEVADSTDADSAPPRKPWAPAPWTGAYGQSSVMLANTFRIEGPTGLLEHVVASSDDAFYERSLETTPERLLQVIRRVSPDVPEIRVQLDAWTLAAFDRVTILERVGESPVQLIASGDALWRDSNGRIAKGERIECIGEIGVDTPAIPAGAIEPAVDSVPSADGAPEDSAPEDGASEDSASEDSASEDSAPEDSASEDVAPETAPIPVPDPVATEVPDVPEGADSNEVQ